MIDEVYLDWNATAPPLPEVIDAMVSASRSGWGNPSSVHATGRRARALVETAREVVAVLLGVDPRNVIFTSGATEANNAALCAAPALITSRLEHPSVVRVAEKLGAEGRRVVWLPVPASGRLDPDDVRRSIEDLPSGFVCALMMANHETGALQPVAEVSEVVHRAGGRLHIDAAQAVGKIPSEAWAGADTLAVAAHKIRGPKGVGALAWRAGQPPPALLQGGAQERGMRPGTQDTAATVGFGVAAEHALAGGSERYRALAPLRDALENELRRFGVVNAGEAPRLPHVTNVSVAGWRGDELVAALDLSGVRISSGSACSAGTTEPSSVITAMLGRGRAEAAVRASLGELTTRDEIARAISAFVRVLTRESRRTSSIA